MLVRIKENAEKYRDPIGRKMRADAPVLVAGVASFPRVEAEKDPELYARWESLTIAYLQGKYGDNLHYGHKAKKNFIAASKAFQDDYHAQVAIHCGMPA